MPVVKDNMNYASVVIVGYLLFSLLFWQFQGRHTFHALEEEAGEDNMFPIENLETK